MKSPLKMFVSKKRSFTKTLIIAGLVLISLPSCKHAKGNCDAYQGSGRSNVRSVKKFKHHTGIIDLTKVADKA